MIKSERTHTLRSNLSVRTLYDQIERTQHATIKSGVRTLYAHSTIKASVRTLDLRTLYDDQIWAYAHSNDQIGVYYYAHSYDQSERTHTLRSNLSVRTLYDQIWAYAHTTIKSERTHTLRSNLSVRTLYDQIWAYAHSTIKSERTHTL